MKVRCIFAICSKKQHDITPRNPLSSTTRNAKLFIVNKQYVFSLSLTTKGHIAFSYPYFPDHQVQNIDRSNVLSLFCEFRYHNCRNLNLCIINFSSVWTDWNLILESDVALPSSLFTLLVGLRLRAMFISWFLQFFCLFQILNPKSMIFQKQRLVCGEIVFGNAWIFEKEI